MQLTAAFSICVFNAANAVEKGAMSCWRAAILTGTSLGVDTIVEVPGMGEEIMGGGPVLEDPAPIGMYPSPAVDSFSCNQRVNIYA